MEFKTVIQTLAQALGKTISPADEDMPAVEIALQDGTVLTIDSFEEAGYCSISGLLCFLPGPDRKADLYSILLQGQAFGALTQQAYFAVDEERAKVLMFRNFNLQGLEAEALEQGIVSFVEVLRAWKTLYDSGELWTHVARQREAAPSRMQDFAVQV